MNECNKSLLFAHNINTEWLGIRQTDRETILKGMEEQRRRDDGAQGERWNTKSSQSVSQSASQSQPQLNQNECFR